METTKEYKKGEGVFSLTHIYYQNGTHTVSASNNGRMPIDHDSNHIRFAFYYRKDNGKKAQHHVISINSGKGFMRINSLDKKTVSKMKLDSRKTWFGVSKLGVFHAIVGFRRVPRKWVPEMDALLITM